MVPQFWQARHVPDRFMANRPHCKHISPVKPMLLACSAVGCLMLPVVSTFVGSFGVPGGRGRGMVDGFGGGVPSGPSGGGGGGLALRTTVPLTSLTPLRCCTTIITDSGAASDSMSITSVTLTA